MQLRCKDMVDMFVMPAKPNQFITPTQVYVCEVWLHLGWCFFWSLANRWTSQNQYGHTEVGSPKCPAYHGNWPRETSSFDPGHLGIWVCLDDKNPSQGLIASYLIHSHVSCAQMIYQCSSNAGKITTENDPKLLKIARVTTESNLWRLAGMHAVN